MYHIRKVLLIPCQEQLFFLRWVEKGESMTRTQSKALEVLVVPNKTNKTDMRLTMPKVSVDFPTTAKFLLTTFVLIDN